MKFATDLLRDLPRLVSSEEAGGVAIVGMDGRLVDASPELERIFQMPRRDLLRKSFRDVTHPEDLLRDDAHFERLVAAGTGSYSLLKRYRRARGDYIWCELDVTLVSDPSGAASHIVAQIRPTTVRDSTLNLLHDQVLHDPLTRLLNRTTLLDQLETSLHRTRRTGVSFALAILDLDGFKAINDSHGHDTGDALLRQVADRLRGALERPDLAGRLGGDEFAFIFRDAGDPATLDRREARLMAAFDTPFRIDRAGEVTLGASLGRAVFCVHGTTVSDLLRHADHAMYACKRTRRALPKVRVSG
ncbi:diguanylate cyclase [Roseovarius sp. SCSIO 43702]|uniref:GGDEF domain-containing protein n=1 Tax=Roseovarius sp. SCSIO 43702 TaxID=2823043 RepID=UPI001C72B4F8|nr:GGDEF domain-containing protein [Roseovarius sp. SCSIO 43702]QYX58191.1 diguanylate cyclase [Roseovarius sp. SCSIO 43702]